MKPTLPGWLAALNRAAMLVSALSMVLIMMLIVTEAVLRYLWGRSLGWTYDLITLYVIVAVFFLAAPDTFARGGNVNVETLQEKMSWRWQALTELIATLMLLVVMGLIVHRMWLRLGKSLTNAEVISGVIAWPTWPTWAIALAGFGLLIANILARLWLVTRALLSNEPIRPLNHNPVEELK